MSKAAPSAVAKGTNQGRPWSVLILKGAFLFGLWTLLSGKLDAFHLGTGALGVIFLLWLDCRLEPLGAVRGGIHIRPIRWIRYYVWLLGEMVLSGIYVARVVLRPNVHLDPQLVRFRSVQPNIVSSVTLASSITLTPGTLTVDLQDDVYVVHALTARTAQDLLTGSMPERVSRLFTDEPLPPLVALKPPELKSRLPREQ